MILGILSSPALYEQIVTLNFRGNFDIRHISTTTIAAAQKALEAEHPYTDVLIDIDSFKANTDETLALIARLLTTTQYHLMVLADGYAADSRMVRDLYALGLDKVHVHLQGGTALKRSISNLLNASLAAESLINEPAAAPLPQDSSCPAEVTVEVPVTPPSQIDVVAAKAMQIHKPPRPTTKAVTIALAGAGSRIGTTTQALQLALYLRAHDYNCAVVDLSGNDHLQQFVEVYASSSELISSYEFTIQGNHFLTNGKALMQARMEYDYVICDYGEYHKIVDTVSFWEKDIKILVAGVKPWESAYLPAVFKDDDGSLKYIFSFVPQADEKDVLAQMETSAPNTFFASYTPDFFTYCGNDPLYSSIVACDHPKPEQKKKPFLFFQRSKKHKV